MSLRSFVDKEFMKYLSILWSPVERIAPISQPKPAYDYGLLTITVRLARLSLISASIVRGFRITVNALDVVPENFRFEAVHVIRKFDEVVL